MAVDHLVEHHVRLANRLAQPGPQMLEALEKAPTLTVLVPARRQIQALLGETESAGLVRGVDDELQKSADEATAHMRRTQWNTAQLKKESCEFVKAWEAVQLSQE
eukprot:TRINITY_DN3177_c0_g2_i9.p2 TRINITY_DN3177_c0_g2~~TRINITY_DN3177_c0_g2_i9.p2  ORF type:complete len:105 (-),score=23.44 TRINITY_DN3177_c0_g2_i9:193-507(-)